MEYLKLFCVLLALVKMGNYLFEGGGEVIYFLVTSKREGSAGLLRIQ